MWVKKSTNDQQHLKPFTLRWGPPATAIFVGRPPWTLGERGGPHSFSGPQIKPSEPPFLNSPTTTTEILSLFTPNFSTVFYSNLNLPPDALYLSKLSQKGPPRRPLKFHPYLLPKRARFHSNMYPEPYTHSEPSFSPEEFQAHIFPATQCATEHTPGENSPYLYKNTQFQPHADFGKMERKESSKTYPVSQIPFQTCPPTTVFQSNFEAKKEPEITDFTEKNETNSGHLNSPTLNLQHTINMQIFAFLDIVLQKLTQTQKEMESTKETLRTIIGMVYTGIIPGMQLLETQLQKTQEMQENLKGPVSPSRTTNIVVQKAPTKIFGAAPEKRFKNYAKLSEKRWTNLNKITHPPTIPRP